VTAGAPTGTFRGAWRHRRWRWLLASYAVSVTGDYLYFVALVVVLYDATGSAAWVAASAVARMLGYVFLSPFGGVVADRFDRRRLLVGLDLARAVVMGALAYVAWTDGPPALAIALAVLCTVATVPYRPACVAATPSLVAEDDLAAANALESIVAQISYFAGPALGALAVAVADPGTAFAVNGATFIVSAALVTRAGPLGGGKRRRDGGHGGSEDASFELVISDTPDSLWGGVAQGLAVVRGDPGLIALIGFVAATMFLYGFEDVVHVVIADDLGMGANGVGVLGAAIGAGGLLMAPFSARLGAAGAGGRLLALSGVFIGLPMILLAVIDSAVLACVVLVLEGVGVIIAEVLFITLLQRTCPERSLGTVYGLQDSVTAGTQMAASIAAPILLAGVGLGWSLVVGGGVVVAASVLLAPALNRLALRVDADRRRLAPVVQRLRRLGIFGEASHAALERIARATTPVTVPAGTVVCRQGDVPDDLYVIDDGEVAVSTSAQGEVNRLRADDWFGEIGLLRRVPRTATVTTTADCELLRIPGTVFIDALAVAEVLPDPLRSTMTIRLAQIRHPLVEAGRS
jgi:MFS family permease